MTFLYKTTLFTGGWETKNENRIAKEDPVKLNQFMAAFIKD